MHTAQRTIRIEQQFSFVAREFYETPELSSENGKLLTSF